MLQLMIVFVVFSAIVDGEVYGILLWVWAIHLLLTYSTDSEKTFSKYSAYREPDAACLGQTSFFLAVILFSSLF